MPPRVTTEEKIESRVGAETVISCFVTGTPEPEIVWVKNGALVEGNRFSQEENALVISQVSVTDQGTFWCVATNSAGEQQSSTQLVVLEAPYIEGNYYNEVTIEAKQKLLLECEIATGNPPPTIRWFKDDIPVDVSSRVTVSRSGGRLRIKPIIKADSGRYRCYAENDAGNTKKEFSVEVVVSAKVDPDFDLVNVQAVGDHAQFNCITTGTPPPRIIWEHNGQILQSENDFGVFFRHGGQTMVIDSITLDWAGNLTCRAINEAGMDEFTTELEVFQTPFFSEQLNGSISVIEGHDLDLNCSANGVPPPVIFWEHDNRVIEMERFVGMSLLALTDIKESMAGIYTCIASSLAGVARQELHLFVHSPPEMIVIKSDDDEGYGHSEGVTR